MISKIFLIGALMNVGGSSAFAGHGCLIGLHTILDGLGVGEYNAQKLNVDEFVNLSRAPNGTYKISVNRHGRRQTLSLRHSKSGCGPNELRTGEYLVTRTGNGGKLLWVANLSAAEREILSKVQEQLSDSHKGVSAISSLLRDVYTNLDSAYCGVKYGTAEGKVGICEYVSGKCVSSGDPSWSQSGCVRVYMMQAKAGRTKEELLKICERYSVDLKGVCLEVAK